VLALAVGALLTGGLHFDALADTADGLGGRTRERTLEIMRDHAIGSYGATALGLDLLLKAGALAAIDLRTRTIGIAAAAGALSRAASVALAAALPYARAEGGTGASLTTGGRVRALVAAALALGVALAAAGLTTGAAMAAVALALAVAAAVALRAWLGGVTGDTLGAVVELTEAAGLVVAVAILV
jgi:adenosylcobinamide-GDP ribazoletransferase